MAKDVHRPEKPPAGGSNICPNQTRVRLQSEAMEHWDVLVVAGPSGVGKSQVSYPLARHFGVSIVEVDDLFHAVEAATTPDQQPLLHFWQTHPEELESTPERILDIHLNTCRAMGPSIASVIENHIETAMPIVLDGDYVLPEVAAAYPDRVKSVFLIEDSPVQIVRNLLSREPNEGNQRKRADVSVLFGHWLRGECSRFGLVSISARPWTTILQRVIAVASG
jgi:2-phosphoglycerate kinase